MKTDPYSNTTTTICRIAPPVELSLQIDSFHLFDMKKEGTLPCILPGNGVKLIIPLSSELYITEQDSGRQKAVVEPFVLCNRHNVLDINTAEACRLLVVSFRPGRFRHFGPSGYREIQDKVTLAKDLWTGMSPLPAEFLRAAPTLDACAAILSANLLDKLRRAPGARFDLFMDLLYLHPEYQISQLAKGAGLSLRQFERVFSESYGVSPKFFARVARMQRVARKLALDPANCTTAAAAAEAGFFDQSHFVHEVRKLTNLSPKEFSIAVQTRPHFYNPTSMAGYRAVAQRALPPLRAYD